MQMFYFESQQQIVAALDLVVAHIVVHMVFQWQC